VCIRRLCDRSIGPPPESEIRRADILNAGKRIAILVGRGALSATDELELLAEVLGAHLTGSARLSDFGADSRRITQIREAPDG
jgi:thiamine pyrophosphate-dependent acetolactate synthase large subunit-like protein